MRLRLLLALSLALSADGQAQEIVKVPASSAPTVGRPDDLFNLPPGQWQYGRQLWQGNEPCTQEQCEAGFTSGDLVVSVEHAKEFVRIIAGLRNCSGTAFSEIETGTKPSKSAGRKVVKQIERVVKGLRKTCHATVPAVPPLDTARLFPTSEAPGAV